MKPVKKKSKDIFEIYDTNINVTEIMEEIESSLKRMAVDKEEIERISRLRFSPGSPSGYREFDSLGTANLFENGVSIPKFTNPSLWFVKGPLQWIITKIISFYAVIEKKLSENRIRAFYNVIHELVLLKNKVNRLQEKLDIFYSDFSEMMARLKTGLNPEYFVSDGMYDRDYEKHKTELVLSHIEKKDQVLVLYPGWGWILSALSEKGCRFNSVTDSEYKFRFIKKEISSAIELKNSLLDFTDYKKYNKIIIYRNLAFIPGWVIDSLLQKIKKLAAIKTELIIIYNNFPETAIFPFESAGITKVNEEKLSLYLKESGFNGIRFIRSNAEILVRFKKQ